jgi:hypothetical protein
VASNKGEWPKDNQAMPEMSFRLFEAAEKVILSRSLSWVLMGRGVFGPLTQTFWRQGRFGLWAAPLSVTLAVMFPVILVWL